MRIIFLYFLLVFPSLSFGNTVGEFFSKFQARNNYYIYKDKPEKWIYDCTVEANWGKNSTNINSVSFDQKNQSIKFSFDTPDHPFYKVTKILKIKPNEYEVYFQDQNMGVNFNFEVILKSNGISEWLFHTPNEDTENFIDRSFTLVSFNESPKFNITNKCK
ncbi:hypothetical protein [Acinetobacter baumannii]|uniref:hypothetical protein n=1 Tax=Acinetobacter baumannii TaxID=470 RepID=UPI00044983E4|nr:hypothetical protein [Acinetobacter baumannii]EKV4527007.1 hypothetical protein [Acinetobacter baumannii]EXB81361.1 hypothetical protein J542_3034 [Acinetobacter baumannii 299505]KQF23139.1 hypothetical protein APC04_05870 [Acinetobacter baumannii]MBJ9482789.1 hypothetical protein [Acinetobacter baumannii]MBJ9912478.1 hypothetical protein [Acinetobacter baumannii]